MSNSAEARKPIDQGQLIFWMFLDSYPHLTKLKSSILINVQRPVQVFSVLVICSDALDYQANTLLTELIPQTS